MPKLASLKARRATGVARAAREHPRLLAVFGTFGATHTGKLKRRVSQGLFLEGS